MKRTTDFFHALLPVSLLAGCVALNGCSTNEDIDLGEIDTNIGIGSDTGITLPSSSTNFIKLADVLKLNEGDCVQTLANGDYLFSKSDDITPAYPKVQQVSINPGVPTPFDFNIIIPPVPVAGSAEVTLPLAGQEPAKIVSFGYQGSGDPQIISLSEARVSGSLTLNITLPPISNNNVTADLDVYLPYPLVVAGAERDASTRTQVIRRTGVTLNATQPTTVSLNLQLQELIDIKKSTDEIVDPENYALFKAYDASNPNPADRISLQGSIRMRAKFRFSSSGTSTAINDKITASLVPSDIHITHAEGIFNPDININPSTVAINGIPDFLNDKRVVLNLSNPIIMLSVTNNLDVKGLVSGVITANYKDGKKRILRVNGITVKPHTGGIGSTTATKVAICRKNEGITADQVIVKAGTGETTVDSKTTEVNDISKLLTSIPQSLEFALDVNCDQNYTGKIDLYQYEGDPSGHGLRYELHPAYDFDAALNFDQGSTIVYNDTIDDWNKDILKNDIDITQGTKIEATATIINRTPMRLYVTPVGMDTNRQEMSNIKVTVDTGHADATGSYVPSAYGTDDTSTMKVTVTTDPGATKTLDGLIFHITAVTEQGGVTLNSGEKYVLDDNTGNDQTIGNKAQIVKAKDIKITVNGRVSINVDK